MKAFLKVIIFTIAPLFTFSQNIVDTTKVWNNYIAYYLMPYHSNTETVKFTTDTILEGIHYRKVIRTFDESPVNWTPYGFIREDANQKVYYRIDSNDPEKLIYDFDIHLHDTINVYSLYDYSSRFYHNMNYYVNSIDNIMIGGTYKTRYRMCILYSFGGYSPEVNQWIEGVGSTSGILHNYNNYSGCNMFYLLCYRENGILQYQNPSFPSCYIVTSIENKTNTNISITIFPNPFTNFSTFKVNGIFTGDGIEIDFYNSMGKKILTKSDLIEFQISKKDFPSGIYFYTISNKKEKIEVGKIIVH